MAEKEDEKEDEKKCLNFIVIAFEAFCSNCSIFPKFSSNHSSFTEICLRFDNQTDEIISVFWLDHNMNEHFYYDLKSKTSRFQNAYPKNTWILKKKINNQIIQRIKITEKLRQVCKIQNSNLNPSFDPMRTEFETEPDVSIADVYTRRVHTCHGIPIVSYPQASIHALHEAKYVIENILQNCPKHIISRLLDYETKIVILAKGQKNTEIMEFASLKDSTSADGRHWDNDMGGIGATSSNPTCAITEENVLKFPASEDRFHEISVLIHEFAHAIMEVGFDKNLYKRISDLYEECKVKYSKGIYMVWDKREFFAVASEAWFGACLRIDTNDGINSREKLKKFDPKLSSFLCEIYGDGEWQYSFTCIRKHSI